MKSLLICLLEHYYTDMKRMIPAKLSRKIDAEIRSLCGANNDLEAIRVNCKNIAEAEKARLRRVVLKRMKNYKYSHNPGVEHIPCRQGGEK